MIRGFRCVAAFVLFLAAGCENQRCRLVGVYSNGRSEFSASSIVLSSEGYCLFAGGVVGACGSWDVVSGSDCDFVHLRLADASWQTEVREFSALLRIEPKDRLLQLVSITNTLAEAMSFYAEHGNPSPRNHDGLYRFVTNAVPVEISAMLAKFPGELERAKIRAEAFRRGKEAEAARLAAEQPRYDAFRAKILADPSFIGKVELEFVKEGEEPKYAVGRVKWTPESRALVDVLKDRSITLPEDALMKLVEKYPWKSDFFVIGNIFSRDELSAESRRKLHPRMRDFANNLNYDLGGAFYEHPNTPVELVQEAFAWERNVGGFVNHLEARLKREGIVTPRERERLERIKQMKERARREEEARKKRQEAEEKRREEERRRAAEQAARDKAWEEEFRRKEEERERKEREERARIAEMEPLAQKLYGSPEEFAEALKHFDNPYLRMAWCSRLKGQSIPYIPVTNLIVLIDAIAKLPSSLTPRDRSISRCDVLARRELPPAFLEAELERICNTDGRPTEASVILKNRSFPEEALKRAYKDKRLAWFRAEAALSRRFVWDVPRETKRSFAAKRKKIREAHRGQSPFKGELADEMNKLTEEFLPPEMPKGWRDCFRELDFTFY